MKILLVQIKGFENNSLENEIKAFYESKNYEVISKTFDWVDAEMRVATYGIFTHDSDPCDKELFLKIYGRKSSIFLKL